MREITRSAGDARLDRRVDPLFTDVMIDRSVCRSGASFALYYDDPFFLCVRGISGISVLVALVDL